MFGDKCLYNTAFRDDVCVPLLEQVINWNQDQEWNTMSELL